jgi:AraC-like DNA-binding protein
MDFDAWHALFRAHLPGEYSVQKNASDRFAGMVRTRWVNGLKAVEVGSINHRFERSQRDIQRDEADYFGLSFPVSGSVAISQNDREMKLVAGECGLTSMRHPLGFAVGEQGFSQSVTLLVPRRLLTSAVGFDPRGGLSWHGQTPAVRLLSRFILDAQDSDPGCAAAEHHLQLAICDLLGALMAANDLLTYSSYKERMFARIGDIVKHHFTDPNFGPREVAVEAGISLRYLQRFFTARGTTCSRFIQSLRLEHAAWLVRRRNLTRSDQPLADIAHLSGFQDYSHFARLFRLRFGRSPGAEAALDKNSTPQTALIMSVPDTRNPRVKN